MTIFEWQSARRREYVVYESDSRPLYADMGIELPNDVLIHPNAVEALKRDLDLDLRELLARPGDLTAEEIETVRLERELEQAKADGTIYRWRHVSFNCDRYRYEFALTIDDGWNEVGEHYATRVEAARAAAERVNARARRAELEAAKAAEAEAQAVAAQEARIMEAFHAAKIGLPESPKKPRADGYWVYTLAPAEEYRPASMVIAGHSTRSFPYTVRLAAATAAADWAEALTAKPALPEPVTMTPHAKACELKARGYDRMDQDLPCWQREGHYIPMHPMGESYDGYLSRAVIEARQRDNDA